MAKERCHVCLCRFCPFAQRTWIALEEKGLNFQKEEVAIKDPRTGLWKQLDEKPSWFLRLNPRGKVRDKARHLAAHDLKAGLAFGAAR